MSTARAVQPTSLWVSPRDLEVGHVVTIDDHLPSDEGYVHRVAERTVFRDGFVRVRFEVFNADGERRRSALWGRDGYCWDRLYDMRQAYHPPMVEVVV